MRDTGPQNMHTGTVPNYNLFRSDLLWVRTPGNQGLSPLHPFSFKHFLRPLDCAVTRYEFLMDGGASIVHANSALAFPEPDPGTRTFPRRCVWKKCIVNSVA